MCVRELKTHNSTLNTQHSRPLVVREARPSQNNSPGRGVRLPLQAALGGVSFCHDATILRPYLVAFLPAEADGRGAGQLLKLNLGGMGQRGGLGALDHPQLKLAQPRAGRDDVA